MAWKSSIPLIASGVAAVGALVWLGQPVLRKLLQRQAGVRGGTWPPREAWDTPIPAEIPAARFSPLTDDPARAQDDALRAVEDDLFFSLDDLGDDPEGIESPESAESVHAASHPKPADEPYDALDAEDIGRQWLLRATEASPADEAPPEEALEGLRGVTPRQPFENPEAQDQDPEEVDPEEDEEALERGEPARRRRT